MADNNQKEKSTDTVDTEQPKATVDSSFLMELTDICNANQAVKKQFEDFNASLDNLNEQLKKTNQHHNIVAGLNLSNKIVDKVNTSLKDVNELMANLAKKHQKTTETGMQGSDLKGEQDVKDSYELV